MVLMLFSHEAVAGILNTAGAAMLAVSVAYLGYQAQQGGQRSRLRRNLTAEIALFKALQDVDAPRAVRARKRSAHTVEALLRRYVPEDEEAMARVRRYFLIPLLAVIAWLVCEALFYGAPILLVAFGLTAVSGGIYGLYQPTTDEREPTAEDQ